MVAATIGGEIIAVPYACYHLGLYLSIGLLILTAALSHISNMMYLKIKDLTPCHLESIYEIAYLLLGRPAIYIVCIVQYLLNFSSIVLYYVIIGDTLGSISAHFFVNIEANMTQKEVKALMKNESFWVQLLSHRATSVLIVGAALLSIIFMRQLSELREIAYIFIGVMVLFIGMLLVELLSAGGEGITMTYDEIKGPKFDYHLITAFSIIVFSYNVQFLVFPAFSELKNRSNARFAISSILSVTIETIAYMATAFLAILLFGT